MTGSQYGCFARRCHAIDECTSVGRHLQFVPQCRDEQMLWRRRFLCIDATLLEVIDAVDRTQGLTVHPVFADNAMIIGNRSRI